MLLLGLQFDWTVSVSDLLVMGAGICSFIWMALTVRDTIRSLTIAVQRLNEDVTHIKNEMADIKGEAQQHRDWLVAIRAILNLKQRQIDPTASEDG